MAAPVATGVAVADAPADAVVAAPVAAPAAAIAVADAVVAPASMPVAPVAADVAAALARIESRLAGGQVGRALAELTTLHACQPDDVRVRLRLVRLLHQRALGRYGAGAITAAVADWEAVLRLAPEHASARALLAAARAVSR